MYPGLNTELWKCFANSDSNNDTINQTKYKSFILVKAAATFCLLTNLYKLRRKRLRQNRFRRKVSKFSAQTRSLEIGPHEQKPVNFQTYSELFTNRVDSQQVDSSTIGFMQVFFYIILWWEEKMNTSPDATRIWTRVHSMSSSILNLLSHSDCHYYKNYRAIKLFFIAFDFFSSSSASTAMLLVARQLVWFARNQEAEVRFSQHPFKYPQLP